ncbi:MAG: dihydroneopterin aldolase [Bacteroidaceae bacterium]|nr:dihydroneopterin aldolase [Bacteroidaceae bacterium]
MKIKEQTITLDTLRFYAYHGAEPQEAIVGAWYTVDITIKADATDAILGDNLSGTINYAKVTEVIKQQMQIRSALLEHVAGRIANALLKDFPAINSLTVKVCKENPPVCAPCTASGFTLAVER